LDEEVPESESLLFALLRLRHGCWRANGEVSDSPQFDLLRQVWWSAVTCKKKQVARQKVRSADGKYKRAPHRRVRASKPIDRFEQLLAIQRTNERLLLDPRTKERLLSDEITMELVTDYFAMDTRTHTQEMDDDPSDDYFSTDVHTEEMA
jgi:hypothetical protein